MDEIERGAPTVEEAIEAALSELGVSEQEAVVQIVQEPRPGFLGLRSQQAVVRVSRRQADLPDQGDLQEQAEAAADFLEGLLDHLGMDADVDIGELDGITYLEVSGGSSPDDMGLLIGKHGYTLDALQELVRSYVHRQVGERCQVVVDVEDYRKRRRTRLIQKAKEAAQRVRKTGRPESFEPMSPFERKIIHDAIAEFDGLETMSEGEGPTRHVVVRRR